MESHNDFFFVINNGNKNLYYITKHETEGFSVHNTGINIPHFIDMKL